MQRPATHPHRTIRIQKMALSRPRSAQKRSTCICSSECSRNENPASHTEQCASGQPLPARASASEHSTDSHYPSTSECETKSRTTRNPRAFFNRCAQTPGKQCRKKSAKSHTDYLDDEPVYSRPA